MMKQNRFVFILIFIFSCFLICAEEYIEYIVKKGDQLKDIAIEQYSQLPYSEKNGSDNKYRAYLIYKTNRESAGLSFEIKDYDLNPLVNLVSNTILRIPVYDKAYPSPEELQALILEEIKAEKDSVKAKNEYMGIAKSDSIKQDEIIQVIYEINEDSSLNINEVEYQKDPYRMNCGVNIPIALHEDTDFFVWQIIEHQNVDKTIIIIPDTHTNLFSAYKKYLLMIDYLEQNQDKNKYILMESLDNDQDNELLGKYAALKNTSLFYDFKTILTTPYKKHDDTNKYTAVMRPSMALFYSHNNITMTGIEDRDELEVFEQAEKESLEKLEKEFELYRESQLTDFYSYYHLATDIFLLQIENEILKAEKQKILSSVIIAEINRLIIELARVYLSPDYPDIILAKYEDTTIENILKSIDTLCGSATVDIYQLYKTDIIKKNDESVSPAQLSELESSYKELMVKNYTKILEKRDQAISRSFSELGDNSLGICELGYSHIYNQLALCLEKKAYNLVIYYHPRISPETAGLASLYTPDEHKKVLEANLVSDSFFKELRIPGYYTETFNSDERLKKGVQEKFIQFFSTDFSIQDNTAKSGKPVLLIKKVSDSGAFYRTAVLKEDNTIEINYVFIPGSTLEEQRQNITQYTSAEDQTSWDIMILNKFTFISSISEDI